METTKTRYLSQAALTAKAIRTELKVRFPAIKFKVRCENFAGGDAVDISYTNGIPEKEVEAITRKYQYGHFNGMEDIYEYSNSREDIPQAKWVSVRREVSPENIEKVKQDIMKDYGMTEWTWESRQKAFGFGDESVLYRTYRDMTF